MTTKFSLPLKFSLPFAALACVLAMSVSPPSALAQAQAWADIDESMSWYYAIRCIQAGEPVLVEREVQDVKVLRRTDGALAAISYRRSVDTANKRREISLDATTSCSYGRK
jgi:hypothetical protein